MALNDLEPKPAPQPGVYKAKDVSGKLPQYDAMRARLTQRTNADTQQQQDAMQRRFAAQGGLNSGAALKQQQVVAEAGAQNREQAMEGVDAQESEARQKLQESEAQKEFQSQEAATGRDFAANESKLGREFQRGMFDEDMNFKTKVQAWSESHAAKQLEMAMQEMEFNKASAMAGMSDDELDAMGSQSEAFREQKARIKGERENAKNRARDEYLRGQVQRRQ